jgi:hypothetical protein
MISFRVMLSVAYFLLVSVGLVAWLAELMMTRLASVLIIG